MQLDRNKNKDGKGKYAVINLRKIPGNPQTAEALAAAILANPECVEFGHRNAPDEFFVIKLKDAFAKNALIAYADAAQPTEPRYAQQVFELAHRAGESHLLCKRPD